MNEAITAVSANSAYAIFARVLVAAPLPFQSKWKIGMAPNGSLGSGTQASGFCHTRTRHPVSGECPSIRGLCDGSNVTIVMNYRAVVGFFLLFIWVSVSNIHGIASCVLTIDRLQAT